jgi:hypothetical protein
MIRFLLTSAVLSGCAPAVLVAASSPQPSQAQADPPPDDRAPDEVVAYLLAQSQFQCNSASDLGWQCTSPQRWVFYVTQEAQPDGSTQIIYTTYLGRAFGKPCAKFDVAMSDLNNQGGQGFQAECNDQTSQFQLRTRFVYDQNLNVVDAANTHLNTAVSASKSLRDIRALAKADADALVLLR